MSQLRRKDRKSFKRTPQGKWKVNVKETVLTDKGGSYPVNLSLFKTVDTQVFWTP